ncbi:MAG: prepilin-type N-terminal cleavage/methylation domain-containing protein [Akkermansiaceae bacterium]|nr:prepilin-type N-terminal cleavage/methylation domain-containing protein [Armatimonadota bacterium]
MTPDGFLAGQDCRSRTVRRDSIFVLMPPGRSAPAGFTLIELLVVIAIIAVVAAILFPVFSQSREKVRQTSCVSNLRQISLALQQYVQDFDETYPPEIVQVPPINGGTVDARPFDRELVPYLKNDGVWACPSDEATRNNTFLWDGAYKASQAPRSYGIVNRLITQESSAVDAENDSNTGVIDRRIADIELPAETIALVESWATFPGNQSDSVLSGLSGSTLLGCDAWKLPGRRKPATSPIDTFAPCAKEFEDAGAVPARGHQKFGNYAFADGHVKSLRWEQVRGDDFRPFKLKKPGAIFKP